MAKRRVSHMAKTPLLAPVPPAGGWRQFSEAPKRRIVAETSRPDASVSDIARHYEIGLRLLFRWRKAYLAEQGQMVGGQP